MRYKISARRTGLRTFQLATITGGKPELLQVPFIPVA
jgi:hypothetical protein